MSNHRFPRRTFLAKSLSAAGLALGSQLSRAAAAPCPPTNVRAGGGSAAPNQPCSVAPDGTTLLQASDFEYLGLYRIAAFPYMLGFAVRRVGSDVRFISRGAHLGFFEYSTAGRSLGDTISSSRQWSVAGALATNVGRHEALYWDQSLNRLWFIQAVDYPDGSLPATGYYPGYIALCSLPDGSTSVGDAVRLSLEGVPDRKTHTGVAPVPAAAQAMFGVGPYVAGFGGYASRMSAAGGAVLNLSLYSLPDPRPFMASSPPGAAADFFNPGAVIPAGQFQPICAPSSVDMRGIRIWHGYNFTPDGGSVSAPAKPDVGWVGGSLPTGTFSPVPGKTIYGPLNYTEGAAVFGWPNGDPRAVPPNYVSPVTPGTSAWWSPRPDSHRYWPSGSTAYFGWDKYAGAAWIHTARKRGFVAVASVGGGRSYYINSAGYCDRAAAEVHLFDPSDLAALKSGRLPGGVSGLRPYQMLHLPQTEFGNGFVNSDTGSIHHASYDPGPYSDGKGRLYVFCNRPGNRQGDDTCHVYVYSVNA